MFIPASCAVTFLNTGPQFSVFMLGCVNKVLLWDKWLHKLIAHKGQLGFYEKHESESCCRCSCVQFSTASQSIIFEHKGATSSCLLHDSFLLCIPVCLNTSSILSCPALRNQDNQPSSQTERADFNTVLLQNFCWSCLQSAEFTDYSAKVIIL